MSEEHNIQLGTESRSSITLTKNTKGYNWEIKTYYQPGDEDKVVEITNNLNEQLKSKYGDSL